MYIKIAERLKPFSHLPGSSCMLPGSTYQVQIYPTCLKVFDFSSTSFPTQLSELHLGILGPVKGFTMQNDLEKGEVRVWGETPLGFFRYSLASCQNGQTIRLKIEKSPQEDFYIYNQKDSYCLKAKDAYFLFPPKDESEVTIFSPGNLERISLGNHKSQDWEMVQRRQDLTEIFPIWHRLGQLIPALTQVDLSEGTLELLQRCKTAASQNCPEKLVALWRQLFSTGFTSLLVPQIQDPLYQGIISTQSEISSDISPLILLKEGAKLIGELFLQENNFQLKLLSALPPEFHCGRLLNAQVSGGTVSLEWSKKRVRRCEFKVNLENDVELELIFRHAKQCRMRMSGADKGEQLFSGQLLCLKKNYHYFFDNFF